MVSRWSVTETTKGFEVYYLKPMNIRKGTKIIWDTFGTRDEALNVADTLNKAQRRAKCLTK